MKSKLKSNSGSSLMEMLCVVGISVLIGAVLIVGLDFATGFYKKTVADSEARILSSTLTTAVTDELRYIGSYETDPEGRLTGFFSQSCGRLTGGFGSEDGRIVLGSGGDVHELLSDAAYTNGITADIDVVFDETEGVFKVKLSVFNGEEVIESEFEVMPLNPAG